MRARKVVVALSMLLLTSVIMQSGHALTIDTITFHGVGVTVNVAYPEEAHPSESITHDIIVTAETGLTLENITVVIMAPPNSTWQTKWEENNQDLPMNANLTKQMRFTPPSNANGSLSCLMYIKTNQSPDYLSFSFYTTQVRELTYSEVLSTYNQLLYAYDQLSASYGELKTNYENLSSAYANLVNAFNTLNATHTELLANYSNLNAAYNSLQANLTTLNSTYNLLLSKNAALQSQYDSLVLSNSNLQTNHDSLQANYNSLNGKNNALQSDFNSLNATRNSLQTTYNTLRSAYDALNATYVGLETQFTEASDKVTNSENLLNIDKIVMFAFVAAVAGLIALIIYLKKKEPEPYVVIRKETVSVKPDEKQQTQ